MKVSMLERLSLIVLENMVDLIRYVFPNLFICLIAYSINLCIISSTTNNASVNDIIVEVAGHIILSKYSVPYTSDMHIRCIVHVVNLVVQAILAAMNEADDPDDVDYFTLHKGSLIHYNIDEDDNQAVLESESVSLEAESKDKDEEIKMFDAIEKEMIENVEASSPLKQVITFPCTFTFCCSLITLPATFITTKIVSSPLCCAKFHKITHEKYGNNIDTQSYAKLLVVHDVCTCWNYTHAMIHHALLLQEAIIFNHASGVI